MKFTIHQFMERFGSHEACLEEIKQLRFAGFVCPQCGREDMLSKIKGRPQYACPCGFQVSPLAGTIFHKSRTDLRTWFYVLYIMSNTRSGVSAMQIQRETGVTYKAAWRMMKQIRSLMAGGDLLTGIVEVDETFFKPKPYRNSRVARVRGLEGAQILFGATTRGGAVRVRHIQTTGVRAIRRALAETVAPGSELQTDGAVHYRKTPGYRHEALVHWRPGKFVPGRQSFMPSVDLNTQNIENFWGGLKRGVYGVYRHVAPKYLESYANEYAFRYSHRRSEVGMFELLMERISR